MLFNAFFHNEVAEITYAIEKRGGTGIWETVGQTTARLAIALGLQGSARMAFEAAAHTVTVDELQHGRAAVEEAPFGVLLRPPAVNRGSEQFRPRGRCRPARLAGGARSIRSLDHGAFDV